MSKLKGNEIAEEIERYSGELNDKHYGITPQHTHYTGGVEHNDDRLFAEVDGKNIRVSDTSGMSEDLPNVPMTLLEIHGFVDGCWMENQKGEEKD